MALRILFDATPFNRDAPSGAGRYLVNLLSALGRIDRENRFMIFGFEDRLPGMSDWQENFSYKRLRLLPLGPFAREQARRAYIGSTIAGERIDLLHTNLDPVPPQGKGVVHLCMLYDVMRGDDQYQTRRSLRNSMRTHMRYSLAAKADHLLTISEYSKERIVSRLGVVPEKITVTYLGVDDRFVAGDPDSEVLAALGLDRPYILFLGEMGRQKNEFGLAKSFLQGVSGGVIPNEIRLAMAGNLNQMTPEFSDLLKNHPAADRICLPGAVADDSLVHLYRGAMVFVMPSFVEGFGLPVVEAMACGTPVICSDVSSLPEVAGDAALLVDPKDHSQMTGALAELLGNPARRQALRRRGLERAKLFSFKAVAEKTRSLYLDLCRK